jgi:hypothetical protein
MSSKHVKNKSSAIALLILFGIALVISVAVTVYYAYIITEHGTHLYPEGPASYFNTGEYAINPKTILADLDQKNKVFTPIITPVEVPLPTGSFPWRQSDYLKIATQVHTLVWKESLENWKLYELHFDTGCHDNPNGFDSGEATYFKPIEINGQQQYTARGIGVYPLFRQVAWGGETTFPHYWLLDWNAYDLEKLKIRADDALEMAEKKGGKESRLKVNNTCSLSVNLLSDGWWHVKYFDKGGMNIFSMTIDPYTGKYNISNAVK